MVKKCKEKEIRKCPKCGSSDLKNSMLLSGKEIAIAKGAIWIENNEFYLCKKCNYYGPVFKIEKIKKK